MTESGYPSGLVASSIEAAIRFYWDPEASALYNNSSMQAQLIANGLLAADEREGQWKLTARGQAFVRHLLDTPLPTQCWEVQRHATVRAGDDA